MSEKSALKSLVSDSYNAMSRPAMFAGMPLMPMVGLLLGGLISGVTATALLSWIWGLAVVLVFAAALFSLRLLCALDAQYLRRVRFALRRLRLNYSYGKALMLTSLNPHWSKVYAQRFSKQRFASGQESGAAALRGGRSHGDAGQRSPGELDPP